LRRYLLENIDYHLDAENLRGLTRYYELAAELGLITRAHAIEMAAEPGSLARHMDVVAGGRGNPS